jgi:hypothetical protein
LPPAGELRDWGCVDYRDIAARRSDFDLRLIKPASVSGRVMDGEAIPDFCGHFRAEDIRQRLTAVDIEVVHYQVDGFRFRVRHRQGDCNASELKARTIGRGKGEMTACFGFHSAEDFGRPATLIFVIPARLPSRQGRRGRPHVGMQGDRLFVHTDHRLQRIVRPFIHLQNVFHLGDIVIIEIGHRRGRDAGLPAPPAQIPTSGATA